MQQLIPNHSRNNFRQARKCQTFKKVICGKPASIKSFKKWVAGVHIGAQETILLLHQKDKLKNKIKQDHFTRLQQGRFNEPRGTNLDEYFHFLDNRTNYPTIMHTTLALNYEKINHYLPSNYYSRAFWNVQKHDFLILGLSEMFRNE